MSGGASALLEITCNLLKASEKSCVEGVIGLAFVPDWLKNWHKILMET